jgi:hypothetical protein
VAGEAALGEGLGELGARGALRDVLDAGGPHLLAGRGIGGDGGGRVGGRILRERDGRRERDAEGGGGLEYAVCHLRILRARLAKSSRSGATKLWSVRTITESRLSFLKRRSRSSRTCRIEAA